MMHLSTKIISLLIYLTQLSYVAGSIETKFLPSHDAFVRKDKANKSQGKAPKITITQSGSNQRIGLMKFDTADYDEENFDGKDIKAYLRLGVAETNQHGPVHIKVMRLENDFHEDSVSWGNLTARTKADSYVSFTVHNNHVNRMGEVDVSRLLRPGKDTVFAFVVEEEGHVKFHSKEHELERMKPSLILRQENIEL